VNKAGLSILYLGARKGTSLDRANALRRVGHRVEHVDLRKLLPDSPWVYRITWRLGGQIFSPWILRALPPILKDAHFDLCYIDGGEWVTPRVIKMLRRYANKVINYNIDDPLGMRDVARSRAYRRSLSSYDLCVVVREENVPEARNLGAKRVLRVYRSADEVAHAPRPMTAQDCGSWSSEVLFLGTWFPERGPFLLELVRRGVPLTIRGANWNKAAEWPELQKYWKGGELQGDDYAYAIQCARVSLGLVSKGNRDLHTTRSLEIPALGGLLCAERTAEHSAMYVEGEEALFWGDAAECAEVCLKALSNEEWRKRIAMAGQARSIVNGYYNEKIMSAIVDNALAVS
jgi:spore maturation protein CgeB